MIQPIKMLRTVGDKALTYGVKKPLKALSEAPFMDSICNAYDKKKMNIITGIGVGSIVLKDGYGCYLYVKQSLNNEKIPEDKRKFVAALDLTNGGLMIASQLLMFFTISQKAVQAKMFEKLFGKAFNRPASKSWQDIIRKQEKFKDITGKEFHAAFSEYKQDMTGVLSHLTGLLASTIIAKRVIVPFIATPFADKAKAWMSRNDKEPEVHKDTKNTYNTHIPAVAQAETTTQSTNLLAQFATKNKVA